MDRTAIELPQEVWWEVMKWCTALCLLNLSRTSSFLRPLASQPVI
jgi:hypothetical protein